MAVSRLLILSLNRHLNWLGDSSFPRTAERLDRQLSDSMFEDIFTQYSSLGLSHATDRPVAIAGLESRLAQFYRMRTAYGVFFEDAAGQWRASRADYPRRCLLWKRASATALRPIDFTAAGAATTVPSWSWMACSGAIQYGARNGWHRHAGVELDGDLGLDAAESGRIVAPAARFTADLQLRRDEALRHGDALAGWARLDYDGPVETESLRCIVMGRGTAGWKDYAGVSWAEDLPAGGFYYVILVARVERQHGDQDALDAERYQRCGVAVVNSGYLLLSEPVHEVVVI